MNKWISVEDRLPEEQQCILVCEKDYGVMFGDYQGIKYSQPVWIVRKQGLIIRTTEVTHWQPLPEPPKTNNENDDFKVDDVSEQIFRDGYTKGKAEDSRIIQIANHYGYTAQSDIIIEECAELTQAICKLRRAWSNERLENVKEELADVLIMARQLRVMLGTDDIDRIIGEKLDRQIERIAEEE